MSSCSSLFNSTNRIVGLVAAHLVALRSQNAAKMMCPAARLHCYDAPLQFCRKLDNSLTAHASPQHNGSTGIQPDDAAAVLAQINPENRDLHDLFPPNRLSTDTMSPALRRGAPFHKHDR
jgi:hypothetical protein